MRRSFKASVQHVIETVLGVEPVGAAGMNRLQGYLQRDLSGLEVRPYFGISGDPSGNFDGPMVNPANFPVGAAVGRQGLSVPLPDPTALPNATAPDGLPDVASPEFGDYMGFEYGMTRL